MGTYYKTKNPADVFELKTSPAPATQYTVDVILREVFDANGASQSDGTWIHCELRFGGDFINAAFIHRTDLDVLENYSPEFAFVIGEFVRSCVSEHWLFNNNDAVAPFYANMDYLIALAMIQSKLDHKAQAGPNGVRRGIFGITEAEWDAFRASSFGQAFEPEDLMNPYAQISCAAYQMHADAKALSLLWLNQEHVGAADNPYMPRFGELARCRLIGLDATFAMQKELKTGNHGIGLDVFLKAQGMSDDAVKTLLTDRQEFMTTGSGASSPAESLQGFRNKIETRLDNNFKEALKLIKEHSPSSIVENSGSAAWMPKAEGQIGVSEKNAADHAKIHTYFGATGFVNGTHADPWCAAFVAWCMDQAGGSAQQSYQAIKNVAAGSASWLKWGRPLNLKQQPPVGAVVVMSPNSNTDDAAHVGFFREYVPGTSKAKIKLLGGNQTDMVTHTDFESKDIISIQWIDQAFSAVDVGSATDPKFADILNLIASRESGGNYNAFFGNAGNSNNPAFVEMSISAVRQWQDNFIRSGSRSSAVGKYQIIRKTLNGLIQSMGLDPMATKFDQNTQDAMAMKLMIGRGLKRFLSGGLKRTEFGNALAKEWASFPVLSTISGAHRTVSRGQSYYSGDNLNHAHVAPDKIEAALDKLRA